MIFVTYWFIFFAGVFLPIYWLTPNLRARKFVLLAGCVVFHAHFAGPAGVLPVIFLGVVTYFAGLSRQRWACFAAIGLCVGALVFYKYSLFLADHVVALLAPGAGALWKSRALGLLPAAPPLAISFFVFEFVHYLYDVSHGQPSIRSPLSFALFSIFWPSIVSGPVKRYQQFLLSLENDARRISGGDVAEGSLRLAIGFVKKFAADSLTAMITVYIAKFALVSTPTRWLILATIAMRIVLDFSGYSDMAIGYARMMGIKLPENFNWPYLATSVSDFWQRWHMSLSNWIRDYVYIPLGGNRHGPARRLGNGLIAFGLCGLWHGAGWNFILWGLYHGVGVSVSSSYQAALGPLGAWAARLFSFRPLAWAATMLFVGFGWLLFFYPLEQALKLTAMLCEWKA